MTARTVPPGGNQPVGTHQIVHTTCRHELDALLLIGRDWPRQVRKIGIRTPTHCAPGPLRALSYGMFTLYYTPGDSEMTHLLNGRGMFQCYVNGELVPSIVLSDDEVVQLVMLHLAQARLITQLAQQMASTAPPRQLLHRHKPLKTLPHSPHR